VSSSPFFNPPGQPLAPLALAFGAGIALAAQTSLPNVLPLAAAVVALIVCGASIVLGRTPANAWLILAAAFAGAVRYDLSRTDFAVPNILQVTEDRRLARLRGTLVQAPWSDPVDRSPLHPVHKPTTKLRIEVERQFTSGEGWRPATGLIQCTIPAENSSLGRGDKVEAFGWLVAPSPPHNDGEFDYADRLRRLGVVGLMSCESPDSVLLVESGPRWTPLRIRDRILEACHERFRRWLPLKEAGVAEAAVVGSKSSIRHEDLEPWVNSGTLHMLVVSGWHVTVVAGAAWWLGRFVLRSRRRRALLALAAVWAYTVLTGCDSPATRAAVFTSTLLTGVLLGRPIQAINSLAAGVLVILVADPEQLFHTGAQLSVLAVLGLLVFPQQLVAPLPYVDPDLGEPHSKRTRWCHGLKLALVASVCATVATAPLVGHQFHLFSTASIWLSVLLAPVLTAAIGFSVLVLLLADLPLAAPFAWAATWCIKTLNAAVAYSEWLPGGFYFVAGPPLWWVAGIMILVWTPFVVSPRWSTGWRHAGAVAAWSLIGAFTWALPAKPGANEFHQLAVGHGNAGVLETADGQVLLVDCGSMTVPTSGERIIAPFLWRRGVQTIDAIFISHADVDHFNALPALLTRFRVGAVYAPPQFARMDQPAVAFVAEALKKHNVPLKFVWAADRMAVKDVETEVLWPTATAAGRSDNSNSLVLDMRCRGGSVLSTGDLAEEGLRAVLKMEHDPVEVFVIPHHGSRTSNTPALAEWADASIAVASQHSRSGDSLGVYRDADSLTVRTDIDGAFSVRWDNDGLLATTFRTGRRIRIGK